MLVSFAIVSSSLLSVVLGQSTIVNLICPFFAIPKYWGGGNFTEDIAASIVAVDDTATTYSIGCSPHHKTKDCRWGSASMIFTQGSTSMHWSIVNSEDPKNYFSYKAEYTFSSTLAPTVTVSEIYTQGDEGGSFENTQYSATTSTESGLETYTSGQGSQVEQTQAKWYPIQITGGIEKLASITPAPTLGPQSTSSTAAAPSSTSSGGSGVLGVDAWAVVGVAGIVGGLVMDL